MTSARDKLRSWAAANPTVVLAALALTLYVELRVPTEIFYRRLGVGADDAGFGSIEVALLQSAQLLVGYGLFALAGALVYLILIHPAIVTWEVGRGRKSSWREPPRIVTAGALPFGVMAAVLLAAVSETWLWLFIGVLLLLLGFFLPGSFYPGVPRWKLNAARRHAARSAPGAALIALLIAAVALPLFLSLAAGPAAEDVKDGKTSNLFFLPWSSSHVRAVWTSPDQRPKLAPCEDLLYLGEDDSRVLLYDSRADKALRVNVADVELAFPESCESQPSGKGGGGGKGSQNS